MSNETILLKLFPICFSSIWESNECVWCIKSTTRSKEWT